MSAGRRRLQRPRNSTPESQVMAAKFIESAEVMFGETANPMHAWHAFLEARASEAPIPEWVLLYLEESALAIWDMQRAGAQNNADLIEALGLKEQGRSGRGTVFSSFRATDWILYGCTVELYMTQGDQETYAIEDVALRCGVSKSTVRRAWKRYQRLQQSSPVSKTR